MSEPGDWSHNAPMPVNDPSSDSAARAGAAALDPEALLHLRRLDPHGSERLFERLAAAFELLLQRLLPDLDSALQSADLTAIAPLAHTLKSAASALGATALAADCAVIESMLRIGLQHGLQHGPQHGLQRDQQDDRKDDLLDRVRRLRDDLPEVRAAVQALLVDDARVPARPFH